MKKKQPVVNIPMRETIKKGLNFYQWLECQNPKPHKSEYKVLQLRYEQVEDFYHHPLNDNKPKKQHQDYVVVNLYGYPRKEEYFNLVLHSSELLAGEHGKKYYGYRQFMVIPLVKFNNSKQAKVIKIKNRILSQMRSVKPAKKG